MSMAANTVSDRSAIISLLKQAQSHLSQGDTEKALEHLTKAYDFAKSRQDYLAYAALHNRIGGIYEGMGRHQWALTQYEQGMRIIATRQIRAATLVDEALEQLRGGEKMYTSTRGTPTSTDLYRGEINNLVDKLSQSPQALENELAIGLAMNAGNMYLGQNQYAQADSLYGKALELAQKPGFRLRSRQIYANRAWSAIKQRRFDNAEKLLESALEETNGESHAVELRRAFLAVGVYVRGQGHNQKAIAELKKAVALYELAEDNRGQGHALAHLATAHLQRGEFKEAKTHYLKALTLNQQIRDDAIAWHANGGLAKTYYRLGDLKAAIKHYEEYMRNVGRFSNSYFTDQGRVAILESHATTTNEYVDVAIELAQKTSDFMPARRAIERVRARALGSLLAGRQARDPREPGSLDAGPFFYGQQWRHYQLEYALGTPNQMAPGVTSASVAQMTLGVVESEVLLAPDEQAPPVSEQPEAIPPAITFLETYVLADRTAILVKQPDGQVGGAVISIGADSLADLITQYHRALEVDKPRGVAIVSTAIATPLVSVTQTVSEAKLARELYRLLIKPIKKFLPNDPQKTIVMVPHGGLWLVPFAALRDEHGEFFGDQHVLTYAVSESTWRLVARRARTADHQSANAWVVGNPKMPPTVSACGSTFSMESLPGAEREANAIAELFDSQRAKLFVGAQADRLRLEAWHPRFSVLHLATHGFVCPGDPLSSFLVLTKLASNHLDFDKQSETVTLRKDIRFPVTLVDAKQILEDSRLPQIKAPSYPGLLDARTIISDYHLDADLVTLSACQTGLGQLSGEGLIGFTRAFLAAGSRSLLVSLWRVDDQSTKELMISFYRQYLRHGNKGLALQYAMAETRSRYPEPKYWAGFTLVGLAE